MENEQKKELSIQYCPLCNKEHEVHRTHTETSLELKGDIIEYIEEGFTCPITRNEDGNSWAPAKVFDENLLRARDAYRVKHNLLTSSQIIEIRKKYKFTQKELSNLLGGGDVTVARYETKSIQEETFDSLLRMVSKSPSFALEQLIKHKHLFTESRYEEIKSKLRALIKADNNSYLRYQAIANKYIDYEVECDANGYKLLDIDKVGDMISYFAYHVESLYKVKLMKLLWYCDVLFFSKYGRAITGLVYLHKPLGALPLAHNDIIYLPTVRVIEEEYEESTSYHIVPLDNAAEPAFPLEEQEILSKVALQFKAMTGKAISDYMHGEAAYKETAQNDVILYSMTSNVVKF